MKFQWVSKGLSSDQWRTDFLFSLSVLKRFGRLPKVSPVMNRRKTKDKGGSFQVQKDFVGESRRWGISSLRRRP